MVKVIQLFSGTTSRGKATACMLHAHNATLVIMYANPHTQFMFGPKYYMNFNLQRHKRLQIFMQSEEFIFSGQEWCHCISMIYLTYDHVSIFLLLPYACFHTTKWSQALGCCTLLDLYYMVVSLAHLSMRL